ncbi:MAG: RCC1 domain-containing protein [Bdellovibrionia bacterium]
MVLKIKKALKNSNRLNLNSRRRSLSPHKIGVIGFLLLSSCVQLEDGRDGKNSELDPPTHNKTSEAISFGSRIAAAGSHTCALTEQGHLKCWGTNDSYQLGDGTQINSTTPESITPEVHYRTVSANGKHTCAISTSHELKCWGQGNQGQLGNNTSGLGSYGNTPTTIDRGVLYAQVQCGEYFTCGITPNGALKCWGSNGSGQLGDETLVNYATTPQPIDRTTRYSLIATGASHACGITTEGILKCWGENSSGQIGNGSTNTQRSPQVIDEKNSYTSVAVGARHTCGLTTSGTVKCWGLNGSGQLGIGHIQSKNTPQDISDTDHYLSIAAGRSHTCGITTSGDLKCWGSNTKGQIGDNTTNNRLTPQLVTSGGIKFTEVNLGETHTCGLTTNGELLCWGDNTYSQIGDGSNTQKKLPVNIEFQP